MKKIIALVLALAMVLMVGASFAAEADEFTNGDFLGGLGGAAEDNIKATNLDSGDKVYYIQLVEWNGTSAGTASGSPNSTSNAWKLTSAGAACGVSLSQLLNGITATEAATIAEKLAQTDGTLMTTTGTTAIAENVPAGLYYLRAVATSTDTIYNPAFVSADYYDGNNSVDFSTTIGSSAVVKKSTVTFDKQVGHGAEHVYTYNDVKPGDFIPYKIKTQIPAYGAAYDEAEFEITDTFSEGLVLAIDDKHTFKVAYGNAEGSEEGVTDVYTTTAANGASSYKIKFDSEHYLLDEERGSTDVIITYWGKVTTDAPMNVNPLDNTADLKYSNKPGSTSDKHDRTRHYTFSIDGNLLGQTGVITKELLKTGLDSNGNVIEEGSEVVHTETIHPLAGAKFTLTPYSSNAGYDPEKTDAQVETQANGTMTWHGLDAGIYKLVEDSAPAGFVKDGRTFYIEIKPTYTTGTDILESYKILWGTDTDHLTEVTSFTMTHNTPEEDYEVKVISSGAEDAHAKVENTQGVELPSTGGIGTTIFYVLGGLLVVGAAVILVARRKASN